ncbi:DUF4037 domain-containing protein [Actinoplanes sp. NPDC049681]|uniref:DUF4037 domain-containing protein n=1 Tax=Actinoplanes sp. NPDC049681 TaxID=3363905 RepID=UPI00379B5B14
MSGIDLARRFYEESVRPLLGDRPHAAALLGAGSEVLGFDDEVSTDHDFGPRVQIFLPPGTPELVADDRVEVTTTAGFFVARLGVDPAAGFGLEDWLVTPTQTLAELTAGAVFHDPAGELARRRAALAWYPDDVWRYVLAAGWLRVAQEEAFVARAGSTGDDLGSRVVAGRLVRELMRLAFLVERRWAPYPKWLGAAFARLALAADAAPMLAEALAAPGWRAREAALVAAASRIATATNELGLAEPVDPAPRPYYTRDIRVLGADRFVVALTTAIRDPAVGALLERHGGRRGGPVPALPGTIDQVTDSTDVLTCPARCRATALLLGAG